MKFTKDEARRRVLNCAKLYQQKLLNKKLIIIYRERKDNVIRYIEVAFHERNYQHLTGLELIDDKGNVLRYQALNFYRKCIENKLGINEIKFKDDGTSHLKLQALPVLLDVTKITKITGDYNNVRPYLFVDKVMGGVNFCLGLTKEKDEYVPSSALLEDVKKLTDAPSQVLAILEKEVNGKVYETIKHVAKGLNLNHIRLPDEIRNKIDLKNYVYKDQQSQINVKEKMNIDNFTNRAEAYAKGRPGYPKEVIHKIMELAPAGTVFADIGAGTGKFTKDIAEYGYKVYAVEPNADMRKQLAITCSSYENVEILAGSAENTMIPSHSVDILTVAHALHWFDTDAFRKECQRILKPNGIIMVIYNHVPGKELVDFCRQAVDAFFTNPTIWTFQNPINYTRENWLAYIASQDDSPLPGDTGYEEYIMALNEAFDRDCVDGVLCCDRITKVYSEKI